MLVTLRIKNLALVTDLTLDFRPGYNAVTGETGAGKSILIGALSLALGQRADRNLIRAGSEGCAVEAVFDIRPLRRPLATFLEDNGLEPCDAGQLVLKRTFTTAGANRQFVNGSPTTLQTLTQLGDWLVDIHGPHEHQSLLHPSRQLELLDAYGGLEPQREAFAALLRRRQELGRQKTALVVDEAAYARQVDLLRHQVGEIDAARLHPDEEEELQHEYRRAHNAARLLELSQAALHQLDDAETSLMNQAGALGRTLQELRRLDSQAECLASLQDQAVSLLRDLKTDLSHYADRVDVDPARLQALEERLNVLQGLKRKYGSTLAAVLEFAEQARTQWRQLEGRDAELARLNTELAQIETDLARAGQDLTARRRKVLPRFTTAVTSELNDLGFRRSHFDVALAAAEPAPSAALATSTGFDTVEFQFAPNPGEPTRPLRAIASSGELARVMLALKTVLAAQDDVLLLIFDEVDANVGGETAHAVGRKMREIGERRQVLCVTHLAPVAAAAQAHCVAEKAVAGDRTVTDVRWLAEADRVTELARMLGGQSDAARRHARELLSGVTVKTSRS